MRGGNRKRRVLCILCVFCLAGAAFCTANVLRELIPRIEAEHAYEEFRRAAFREDNNSGGKTDAIDPDLQIVTDGKESWRMPDWNRLQTCNPDICGWIYGPGTTVDYPVVQGTDNTWYLEHTADGEKNAAGAIFMESENRRSFEDDMSVLYGHHIRGGRMFSSVSGYKEQDYYDKHPCFYLYTPEAAYRVDLFAGNVISGEVDGFPLQFAGNEARREWIDKAVRESTFKSRTKPEDEERILTLCTCSYEYHDARFAVYGTMKKLEAAVDGSGTD